jgi:predicted dehydrogenase
MINICILAPAGWGGGTGTLRSPRRSHCCAGRPRAGLRQALAQELARRPAEPEEALEVALEAVVITTPTPTHKPLAVQAAARRTSS